MDQVFAVRQGCEKNLAKVKVFWAFMDLKRSILIDCFIV